jgi:hypothetical protein
LELGRYYRVVKPTNLLDWNTSWTLAWPLSRKG